MVKHRQTRTAKLPYCLQKKDQSRPFPQVGLSIVEMIFAVIEVALHILSGALLRSETRE